MIIKIKTLVFCENFMPEYGDVHVMHKITTTPKPRPKITNREPQQNYRLRTVSSFETIGANLAIGFCCGQKQKVVVFDPLTRQ